MCATLFTPHLSALTQIRVKRRRRGRRRWQTHTRGGAGRTAWWWRWTAACSQICGPSHGPFLEERTRESSYGPEKNPDFSTDLNYFNQFMERWRRSSWSCPGTSSCPIEEKHHDSDLAYGKPRARLHISLVATTAFFRGQIYGVIDSWCLDRTSSCQEVLCPD